MFCWLLVHYIVLSKILVHVLTRLQSHSPSYDKIHSYTYSLLRATTLPWEYFNHCPTSSSNATVIQSCTMSLEEWTHVFISLYYKHSWKCPDVISICVCCLNYTEVLKFKDFTLIVTVVSYFIILHVNEIFIGKQNMLIYWVYISFIKIETLSFGVVGIR